MRTSIRMTAAGVSALMGAASLGGCPPIANINDTPVPVPYGSAELQQARSDVLEVLSDSDYASLFTSLLINDGIGIFSLGETARADDARRWGRSYTEQSPDLAAGSEVLVRAGSPAEAKVEFASTQTGVWLGDFDWRSHLVTKAISETFRREAIFEQAGASASWELTAISPASQRPQGAAVDIADVSLQIGAAETTYSSASLPIGALPVLLPGQAITLVLHATGASASA
ncbi:MAG: hypothetical protein KGR26_08485, partial [Cyanobacteria bacterium REEB65]|nr:hypothetical protein [Cyanobacteria bacterium REEB65]